MSVEILRSKLTVPAPPSDAVERPRLLERLDAAAKRDLTIVRAPAGFGKTTLLAQWCEARRDRGRRSAWVSLDGLDADPSRLWAHVGAALGEPAVTLAESAAGRADVALTPLLNACASVTDEVVLILDDYHLLGVPTDVGKPSIHEQVIFLLEHLPTSLRLVVSCRREPPLPLARLGAEGRLSGMGPDELALNSKEAHETFRAISGSYAPNDPAEEIEEAVLGHADGWVAVLRLRVAAAGHSAGTQETSAVGYSGLRLEARFFEEEVLSVLPDDAQRLLLRICVLERLCDRSCQELGGDLFRNFARRAAPNLRSDPAGSPLLASLELAGCPLVPLDREGRRYHLKRPFVEFLRRWLRRSAPEEETAANRRALRWFEHEGEPVSAADHALRAGEVERAAGLLQVISWSQLAPDERAMLHVVLASMPPETFSLRPELALLRAWSLMSRGRPVEAEATLSGPREGAPPHALQNARATLNAARAFAARLRGRFGQAKDLARQALSELEAGHDALPQAAATLGIALWHTGDTEGAEDAFRQARRTACEAGQEAALRDSLAHLARARAARGRLAEAQGLYREALDLGGAGLRSANRTGFAWPEASAYAHAGYAELLYERGDLTGAGRYLRQATVLSERDGCPAVAGGARLLSARLLRVRGDVEAALTLTEQTEATARHYGQGALAERAAALGAWVRLTLGDLAGAWRWARETSRNSYAKPRCARLFESGVLARVRLAGGDLEGALRLLSALTACTEEAGVSAGREAIGMATLRALCLKELGESDDAFRSLGQALRLAESEGHVRAVLDEGEAVVAMLERARERGVRPEYAARLLEHRDGCCEDTPEPQGAPKRRAGPLTDRESQVLALLGRGFSNRHIARELVISEGTVKYHVHNVRRKLGAQSRAQAVVLAIELGLLEPFENAPSFRAIPGNPDRREADDDPR